MLEKIKNLFGGPASLPGRLVTTTKCLNGHTIKAIQDISLDEQSARVRVTSSAKAECESCRLFMDLFKTDLARWADVRDNGGEK